MTSGTTRQTVEARKVVFMILAVVICPPIQSMVVVTSPIGDQAPPALAAMTIIPAKNKTLFTIFEQALHQSNHHDGGGHVVEDGREVEGDEADDPEQARQLGGLDARGDDLEAAVGVGHLDDGHGADQEEYDGCGFGQFFRELVDDAFDSEGACKRVKGPHQARGDQRRGGLVDFNRVLEGYHRVGRARRQLRSWSSWVDSSLTA